MELSVVIPLLNESESIRELHQWITKSLDINTNMKLYLLMMEVTIIHGI